MLVGCYLGLLLLSLLQLCCATQKQSWYEAVYLARNLIRDRTQINSMSEWHDALIRIEPLSRPVRQLRPRLRPNWVRDGDFLIINEVLDLKYLLETEERKCLESDEEKSYHHVYRRITMRYWVRDWKLFNLVKVAYLAQLQLCSTFLPQHFKQVISPMIRPEPNDEPQRFVSHLANMAGANGAPNFQSTDEMSQLMVRFLMDFLGHNVIKTHLGMRDGLENLISHSFLRKCTQFVLKPFRTVHKTFELCTDLHMKQIVISQYSDWLRAHDLCNYYRATVNRDWASQIYHLFPVEWGRDLYTPPARPGKRSPTKVLVFDEKSNAMKRAKINYELIEIEDDSDDGHAVDDDAGPEIPIEQEQGTSLDKPETSQEGVLLPLFPEAPGSERQLEAGQSSGVPSDSGPSFSSQVERMLSNFELARGSQPQDQTGPWTGDTQLADGNQSTSLNQPEPAQEKNLLYIIKGKGKRD